jgi:hypothetical protein
MSATVSKEEKAECEECATGGIYNMACLDCCARLVLTARPSKIEANKLLHYLQRASKFTRAEVLKRLGEIQNGGI